MSVIFHTEASLGWGGQEIRILNESIGMQKRGHRLLIIAQPTSVLAQKARKSGLDTLTLSFERKAFPTTFIELLTLIKKKKPDFVNTHSSKDSWVASIASRVSRHRPYIIRTRHLSTPVSTNRMSRIIYKSLPHKIITTGEAIREQLIERNKVDPNRIVCIPTGVDLNIYNPDREYKNIRQELSLGKEAVLVGMVSVLRSWKGHDYFIEAVELLSKKIPHVRFLIVGDGPRKEAIRETVQRKNLSNVLFMLGYREDIPDIMASLDIVVHPSYANEGVPQTILQGMAMAKPVIASDLKVLKEVVIDGETGLVAPVRDSKGFAERIMFLLGARHLREKLGKAGRDFVRERFSMDCMIDRIEDLYKNIQSSRKL